MSVVPNKLRNVLIAGHSDSGKTQLAEAMLFLTKGTDRLGFTQDGNTVMDFEPEEAKRGASLSSAVAPVDFEGVKINLVDAPGLFDFELGMYEGIMAVENVLITVSARAGLTVGAQKAYDLARKNKKGSMIFISKIDVEEADYYTVYEELKAEFGNSICPVVVPFVEDDKITYVDLVQNKAYSYDDKGVATEEAMPDMGGQLEELRSALTETVAETDEELMEKFFDDEEFTLEEMNQGLRHGVENGEITPVLCGVPTELQGIDLLLSKIKNMFPAPDRVHGMKAIKDDEEIEIKCDPDGPQIAYVFKTMADPFVGKLSFIKVASGVLKSNSELVISRNQEVEKIGKLLVMKGKEQIDADEIGAGDIGAIGRLDEVQTGDTLCEADHLVAVEMPDFPHANFSMAMRPKKKGDESKISGAMQRLTDEDLTLKYHVDPETTQQILSGLGEQHLDAMVAKLKSKFGVEIELYMPRVAYRETIRKKVEARGRHRKQTGGHGQFGDVIIAFEPTDSDELVFEEEVFGGSVPRNFFPAVEKGLEEATERGVLAGYPVVGLKATLLDGSHHPVDSSEMAFKMAARLAYREALPSAAPVLLEPIGELKAYVPDTNTGDLMGEVNKRRGRVLGMNPIEENLQCVEAEVPVSEMHNFTTYMRQLTQGRGYYDFEFIKYEPLPGNLEEKVIAEAKQLFGDGEEEE